MLDIKLDNLSLSCRYKILYQQGVGREIEGTSKYDIYEEGFQCSEFFGEGERL